MSKIAIISPDIVGPIKNGGIGTFVFNFARLLREADQEVQVIFTKEDMFPASGWRNMYDDLGISLVQTYSPPIVRGDVGNWHFIQLSEQVQKALDPDVKVVYSQDWGGNAFKLLQHRQFEAQAARTFVTVLHSPTAWLRDGMQIFPNDALESLAQEYIERYSAEKSDFIAAPSEYMLNWVLGQGWKLPPQRRVLGYPFFPQNQAIQTQAKAKTFRRIIFFGRLETRKGLELFFETLLQIEDYLSDLEEIVLLGKDDGNYIFVSLDEEIKRLSAQLRIPIRKMMTLDTHQAQNYLIQNAPDSLVVMPSLVDNLPFTVIEASLIQGLNLLTSSNGGMAEILGEAGQHQIFDPYPRPFAQKLKDWLNSGPQTHLGRYNWEQSNVAWLNFHEEVLEHANHTKNYLVVQPARVDVCVPYFNHAPYLPHTLAALAQQTCKNFRVIVVDDASTDENAIRVFEEMKNRYQNLGWQFLRNEQNQGLSETRNRAVQAGEGEFLVFVDSDNVPMPHMLETMLQGIQCAELDCLSCYAIAFEGDHSPLEGDKLKGFAYEYKPLGACAELGLFENFLGDANLMIKRSIFEQIGGFELKHSHYRYIVGEDHALLAKLVLAGYKLDVLPEFLFYYRYRMDSLYRTTHSYQNKMRVLEVYREKLATAGLADLIPLVYGLYARAENMPSNINYQNPMWIATRVPWRHIREAIRLKIQKRVKSMWTQFRSKLPIPNGTGRGKNA